MKEPEHRYSVVERSGSWFQHEAVPHEVLVVRQNFDSLSDDTVEMKPEQLNENGELFHVQFCRDGVVESTSPALLSLAEAILFAESNVPSPIDWDASKSKA